MLYILYQIWWSESIVESYIYLKRFFPVIMDIVAGTSSRPLSPSRLFGPQFFTPYGSGLGILIKKLHALRTAINY